MHADTSAIDTFGTELEHHATALDEIGTALAAAQSSLAGAPLGQAAARFTTVLADTVQRHTERIADVSRRVADAADTAHATSIAYRHADGAHAAALAASASPVAPLAPAP